MLDEAITAWTSHHSTGDVLATLEREEVPAGRIYSVAEIVADPHYQARDMLLQTQLPGGASVKMPGIVPKLSDTPGEVHWQGPTLGEHTERRAGLARLRCERRRAPARRRSSAMSRDYSHHLIVQEVAPRDGLQIEPKWVDTADKIALINALSTAGFTRIEAGSFVSPKAIPALRDGDEVFHRGS